jgi:septal ring factor EnvC (AmiA/AmiB activator)
VIVCFFREQIATLKESIQEMNRQRSRQERLFEKERSQFKDQLEARRREISALKKERQITQEKLQVRGRFVAVSFSKSSPQLLLFISSTFRSWKKKERNGKLH